MASAELILEICPEPEAWDTLVAASPQGTIFSERRFLLALACSFRLWQVRQGHKIVALLAAVESEQGEDLIQFPFTPYQGLMFLHEAHSLFRQRVLDEFRIAEFVVQELSKHYRNISISLSWLLQDVRPFLWHHYHQPELGQFSMTPRYTALLDLQTVSFDEIKMQARACRRQELKKTAEYEVRFDGDIGYFMHLYTQTFARQDIVLDQDSLALVERIVRAALTGGYGKLSSCAGAQGIASMNLFVYDNKRAYYLFAANDPQLRNTGAATRLMFENIFTAKSMGLAELDFVGVNSPNRGDFKLSFNPDLKLYFDVHLRQTS